MELIAHGRRANIFCSTTATWARVATKIARMPEARDAIRKEALLLQRLQELGATFTPTVVSVDDDQFSYYWIEGKTRKEEFPLLSPAQQWKCTHQLLDEAYQLDQRGIIHGELDRPTQNILIDSSHKVWLIDFERGWRGDVTGKNMRHLAQRLHRAQILPLETLRRLADLPLDKLHDHLWQRIDSFYSSQVHA